MKNACASDSWPVTPTSSVSPIAPIAALIANRPVCSQKPSAYCGSHSRKAASATQPTRRSVRREIGRRSDTGQLPPAEEPGRPPQKDHEEHDVGHDVRQPAPEE